VRQFAATENASAIVLLAATLVALAWANSPWSSSYEGLWHTEAALRFGGNELVLDLRDWVNDGLMVFFFFVAGLEIRRELDMGELRERRRVATPVVAAVGGVVLPALIYLAFNAREPSARGWGIAMGTDTAFALGVLTLVGGASPRVRTFLLSLVVVDDAVALTVIAVAYNEDVAYVPLLIAGSFLSLFLILRAGGIRNGVPYFLAGIGVWLATLASGIHATIAGVVIGLLATAYPPSREDLARAAHTWRGFREEPSPETRPYGQPNRCPGGFAQRTAPAPVPPLDELCRRPPLRARQHRRRAQHRPAPARRDIADHARNRDRPRGREGRWDQWRELARPPGRRPTADRTVGTDGRCGHGRRDRVQRVPPRRRHLTRR
jgi:hypothetical protein